MPVGNKPPTNYYSIGKDTGKIRYKKGNDEYLYDFIEGRLVRLELIEDEFEGEPSNKYHLHLANEDGTATDILQVGESSSAARGILMSLICIDGPIQHIRIAPYQKDHEGRVYTNVWFEHNGNTVDWKESITSKIPDVERIATKSGKEFTDDADRRQFYRRIAIELKKRLGQAQSDPIPQARTEQVNEHTGEITEEPKGDAGDRAYNTKPSPEYKRPKPNDYVDSAARLTDDVDDDLPF